MQKLLLNIENELMILRSMLTIQSLACENNSILPYDISVNLQVVIKGIDTFIYEMEKNTLNNQLLF